MPALSTPPAKIDSPCPSFSAKATDGKTYQLEDFSSTQALLVMFICNHCPYVQAVETRIIELIKEMMPKGLKAIAFCSNDSAKYPDDSFENMTLRAKEREYPFPYLHDETQEIAKAFTAVCTPDFFLYDKSLKLAYRGQLDNSWKDPHQVTSQDLKEAIAALLHNESPATKQYPSMGCSIKWRMD